MGQARPIRGHRPSGRGSNLVQPQKARPQAGMRVARTLPENRSLGTNRPPDAKARDGHGVDDGTPRSRRWCAGARPLHGKRDNRTRRDPHRTPLRGHRERPDALRHGTETNHR